MKIGLITTVLYFFTLASSIAQHKGTYTGTHGNGKMVAFINDTDGIFIGYFYESRKTHHTLIGTSMNNEVKGQIKLSGLKEFDCEGFFRNDSLMIFVNEIGVEHFMAIALKKVSSKPSVNLDKYFSNEKPTNDPKLVGEWLLLNEYDLKKQEFRTKKDYTSFLLGNDGSFVFKGGDTKYDMSKLTIKWYTQDSSLYSNIESKYSSMEFNYGNYKINGDTLTTTGVRYISKYIKKK
jgi:hypothetical protein